MRVDEFPHYQAWDEPDRFGAGRFERFHEIMAGAGVPYLVAVLPRVSRSPLSPTGTESRALEDEEIALLRRLARRRRVLRAARSRPSHSSRLPATPLRAVRPRSRPDRGAARRGARRAGPVRHPPRRVRAAVQPLRRPPVRVARCALHGRLRRSGVDRAGWASNARPSGVERRSTCPPMRPITADAARGAERVAARDRTGAGTVDG